MLNNQKKTSDVPILLLHLQCLTINKITMTRDNKPKKNSTISDTANRPKPMVPKTALKKNGNRYGCGGKLKK